MAIPSYDIIGRNRAGHKQNTVQLKTEAVSMSSSSTVVCGRICSVHTGDLEEYLVVGGILGDCEPALQGWVIVLVIIPINVCQPLQTLP